MHVKQSNDPTLLKHDMYLSHICVQTSVCKHINIRMIKYVDRRKFAINVPTITNTIKTSLGNLFIELHKISLSQSFVFHVINMQLLIAHHNTIYTNLFKMHASIVSEHGEGK